MDKNKELCFPDDKSQRISRKIFLKEYKGQLLQNLWDDIFVINPMATKGLIILRKNRKTLFHELLQSPQI